MAEIKAIDPAERRRALYALASMAAIPTDDPDRKGDLTAFRHTRIVSEIRNALADPLAAHDVSRAFAAEGIIGPYRTISLGGANAKVSYVNTEKATAELSKRQLVPHYDID